MTGKTYRLPIWIFLAAMAYSMMSVIADSSAATLGPSFICRPGQDPIAQVICGDATLARLDLHFVQAYQALVQQTETERREELRQEAIDFHSFVLRQCRIPVAGSFQSGIGSVVPCVQRAYELQRLAWLSRSQLVAAEEAGRAIEEHVALQSDLQILGLLAPAYTNDGVYGPATRSAIVLWQRSQNLPETGLLGNGDAFRLRHMVGRNEASPPNEIARASPLPTPDEPPKPLPFEHREAGDNWRDVSPNVNNITGTLAHYWDTTPGGVLIALGGLIVITVAIIRTIYRVVRYIKRDLLRQCPFCKRNGCLDQVDTQVINRRRQPYSINVSDGSGSRNETRHTTTEFWRATYHCSACGHDYSKEYTRAYAS
jgi:uncharacterized protein